MIAWYWAVVIAVVASVVASGMGFFAGCLISARRVRAAEDRADNAAGGKGVLCEVCREEVRRLIAFYRTDQAKGE